MSRLLNKKVYSLDDAIKTVESDGWYRFDKNARHYLYRHPFKPGIVVIPRHNRDVKKGTINSILKQAGLKK